MSGKSKKVAAAGRGPFLFPTYLGRSKGLCSQDTIWVLLLNIEDLSVTDCLHMFVTECVNSSEQKINPFIVVVSSLNFLIEEQISSMNVFKGTENVAIVEEFEVPPQILFHILRPFTKLTNFQRHLERKR